MYIYIYIYIYIYNMSIIDKYKINNLLSPSQELNS